MKNIKAFIDGVNGNTINYQVGADSTYRVLVLDKDGAAIDTTKGAVGFAQFYSGNTRASTLVGQAIIHFSDIHKGMGSFYFEDTEDKFEANNTYYIWVEIFEQADGGYGYGDGYSGSTTDVSVNLVPTAMIVG